VQHTMNAGFDVLLTGVETFFREPNHSARQFPVATLRAFPRP
jgi:hypothetical protein